MAEKQLFAYLEKVNQATDKIEEKEIEQLKALGWGEEAIYDAITVCALFNFYNRWTGATGVQDLTASMCQIMGKKLVEKGYLPG